MKTWYQKWYNNHVEIAGMQHSKGWSRIWSLEVPHKVKKFLWRFCRNNIPILILLRGKGVLVHITCPLCEGDVEHLQHLFFYCSYAKRCWQIVGLDYDLWSVENASEWLLDRLSNENTETLIKIAAVLWCIWFTRNKNIFEGKNMTPTVTMACGMKHIMDWRAVNKKKN